MHLIDPQFDRSPFRWKPPIVNCTLGEVTGGIIQEVRVSETTNTGPWLELILTNGYGVYVTAHHSAELDKETPETIRRLSGLIAEQFKGKTVDELWVFDFPNVADIRKEDEGKKEGAMTDNIEKK